MSMAAAAVINSPHAPDHVQVIYSIYRLDQNGARSSASDTHDTFEIPSCTKTKSLLSTICTPCGVFHAAEAINYTKYSMIIVVAVVGVKENPQSGT